MVLQRWIVVQPGREVFEWVGQELCPTLFSMKFELVKLVVELGLPVQPSAIS